MKIQKDFRVSMESSFELLDKNENSNENSKNENRMILCSLDAYFSLDKVLSNQCFPSIDAYSSG